MGGRRRMWAYNGTGGYYCISDRCGIDDHYGTDDRYGMGDHYGILLAELFSRFPP